MFVITEQTQCSILTLEAAQKHDFRSVTNCNGQMKPIIFVGAFFIWSWHCWSIFFFRIVPCISLFCCRKFLKTKVDWISLICNNLSYVLVTKIPFIGTYWSDVPQHAVVWLVSLWKCQLFFDTNDGWSSNLQKLFSCQRRKATGITDSCANNGHFSAEVFSYR